MLKKGLHILSSLWKSKSKEETPPDEQRDETIEHVTIKTIDGELFIARLISEDEDYITVEYPLVVNFLVDEDEDMGTSKAGVGFSFLNPLSSSDFLFTFSTNHVIFMHAVDSDIANNYEQDIKARCIPEPVPVPTQSTESSISILENFVVDSSTAVN